MSVAAPQVALPATFPPCKLLSWTRAHGCAPLQVLPALDELDDIAVRVFDHGNAGTWANLGFGDGELHAFFFEHSAQAAEVADDERQIADAQLLLQTDRASRWHFLGVHQLDIASAEAQAMKGAKTGRQFFGFL